MTSSEQKKQTISIKLRYPDGRERMIEGRIGWTLMEVLREADVHEVEAICGGCLSCSTCHVIVEEPWFSNLSPPDHEETDMLDIAEGLERCSRLSCQISLQEACDGIVVRVPNKR